MYRKHPFGRCNNPHCCPPRVFPTQVSPAQSLPTQVSPAQVFPTQVAPAQVSPTQEVVRTNIFNTVVPHFHPLHTTTVNKYVTQNEHFFPRTQSVVNKCFETQRNCGNPDNPNPGCISPRRRKMY